MAIVIKSPEERDQLEPDGEETPSEPRRRRHSINLRYVMTTLYTTPTKPPSPDHKPVNPAELRTPTEPEAPGPDRPSQPAARTRKRRVGY